MCVHLFYLIKQANQREDDYQLVIQKYVIKDTNPLYISVLSFSGHWSHSQLSCHYFQMVALGALGTTFSCFNSFQMYFHLIEDTKNSLQPCLSFLYQVLFFLKSKKDLQRSVSTDFTSYLIIQKCAMWPHLKSLTRGEKQQRLSWTYHDSLLRLGKEHNDS